VTVTLRTVAPALVFAAKQGFRKIADKRPTNPALRIVAMGVEL
jgi:hypothetical protein